jgi:spermidine synthase
LTKVNSDIELGHPCTVSTSVALIGAQNSAQELLMRLKILKLISYYFPISKKIPSVHSGLLELKFVDGKMLLDSPYSSHSYGTLQQVLEFALRHIELASMQTVLLLGLGGGSVIKSLRGKFRYKGKIEAVEIDPLMISIARNEFGIKTDKRTQIECCEASRYVSRETKTFDLVIVDLFIDDSVSEKILCDGFWCALKDRVSLNGYIIFNSMHEGYSITRTIKNELIKWGFLVKEYNHIESYNTVLIAKSRLTWFG